MLVIDRSVGSGAASRRRCACAYVLRTRYYYHVSLSRPQKRLDGRFYLFRFPRPLFPARHVVSTYPGNGSARIFVRTRRL